MGLLGKVSEGWLVLITGPFTCPLGSILIPLNLILENHLLPGSFCCRKRDPFQGLSVGSCLTLGNELSKETHMLIKQKTIGKRLPGREQKGKGTQVNCSATWLTVSGFMVMGLVSGLSVASHLAWSILV